MDVQSAPYPPRSPAAAGGLRMETVDRWTPACYPPVMVRRRREPPPDVLLALDEEYAQTLALLDRDAATARIVSHVPACTGVDVAWVGEPEGTDRVSLRQMVNGLNDGINGLVVPQGVGLGGRVLLTRRPARVRDYCAVPNMPPLFRARAQDERLHAMVAVPIVHNGQLLGLLYGANRGMAD